MLPAAEAQPAISAYATLVCDNLHCENTVYDNADYKINLDAADMQDSSRKEAAFPRVGKMHNQLQLGPST
jgi:hypothetical protein